MFRLKRAKHQRQTGTFFQGRLVVKGKRPPGAKEPDRSHREYYRKLPPEERMLVTLRDELYGGSWDVMLGDLKDRLTGKPYIFKLINRIEEDILRIERLKAYEGRHQINLNEYAERDG